MFFVNSIKSFVFVTALLVINSAFKSSTASTLFCKIVRLFKPKFAFTKLKNATLFILGSIKYPKLSFLAIAKISPGYPAPVPISAKLEKFSINVRGKTESKIF